MGNIIGLKLITNNTKLKELNKIKKIINNIGEYKIKKHTYAPYMRFIAAINKDNTLYFKDKTEINVVA